ncbi:MAG: ATP synthase F0 subunit B [bacterium]|nr:ATP synthase F0 subunit B [bacterium]
MEFNGTFLATIINFIVFVFLMNKVLYAPILNIMSERENFIKGNYKEVENNDEIVRQLAEQKDKILFDAKAEAGNKYSEVIGKFKTERQDLIDDAQNVAKKDVEQAKNELGNSSNEAERSLQNKMTDLAGDIVEKLLGYRTEIKGFEGKSIDEILYR